MDETPRTITISINSGTVTKVIVVGVLFFALFLLRDLVLITLAAVFIASAIEPAVKFFARYKVGRLLSVVVVYLAVAGIIAGIFSLFLPIFLEETSDFLSNLPSYIPSAGTSPTVDSVTQVVNGSSSVVKDISNRIALPELVKELKLALTSVKSGFWQTVATLFGNVASFILIMVLSFYLAVQEDGVTNFLKVIAPIKHKNYVISLWRRSQEKIGLWIQGQLLLCLLVGVLVYLCLMIFQVPHALAFGVLAAVLELIPVFGPIIAAIPAVISAFSESGLPLGLTVVGIYLLIQQFENHLFYPLVVKKIVGIPPLIVILALIAGWQLAGFWGIMLSIPVGVALMEYFNDLQRERLAEENSKA
jgi:predicted PurR-regulated permease PerM